MKRYFLLMAILLLASCSKEPSQKVFQTAIAQTLTAMSTNTAILKSTDTVTPALTNTLHPTNTPVPSNTPIPTYTPIPTNTPIPTDTPTPIPTITITSTRVPTHTPTATRTSTPTILPMTQTAMAIVASQTAVAYHATATRQAYNTQRTATAVAKASRATEIAQYQVIPMNMLISYPDKYIGQKIILQGQVMEVGQHKHERAEKTIEIAVSFPYEFVYVTMRESFSDIFVWDWITVYGTWQGCDGVCIFYAMDDAFYVK